MQKKLLAVIGLFSCMLLASVVLVIFAFSSHSHTFATEWKYDETNHWHEATCKHTGKMGDKAKHSFNIGMITTAATCDTDGVKTLKCECGATKTEPVVTMGHAYTWETQVAGNCVSPAVLKGICSGCGATTTKESVLADRHTWGKWQVTQTATCTSHGVEERVCSNDKTHKETRELPLGQHEYVGYQITKAPTTTTEGKMKAKCKNAQCGKSVTLKILKTPQITLEDVKLSWKAVSNASGYRLYDNGKLVADLGKVLSCTISTEQATHNYTVEAYTKNTKYHGVSLKSNALAAKVAFGDNLQVSKGTDFEQFAKQKSVEVAKKWANSYYNSSAGKVLIMNSSDNTYAKLLPVANGGSAIMTKSCNTAVLKAGTYRLSFDVKLGSQADGALSFGIWDGVAWAPAWPKVAIDTAGASVDNWTTVTHEFTLAKDKTGTYANLDLAYTCVASGENNYVLVDNIQLIDVATNTNVDTGKNGNFEDFFTPLSSLLKTSGWKSDGIRDVIYVSENLLENEVVVEANGNKCFKFYTSTGASTSINFAGNTAFGEAGIYKMSVKVKLGAGATRVNNIGFRFYAKSSLGTGDIKFDGLEKLNSSEWVTLESYFVVPKTVSTSYINMNFWAYTHNNEIKSVDNYVLMDDIAVYPVTINGCDHEYAAYEMTTAPTTTTEGEMTATCKNKQCKEVLTLKVLMTPQLTKDRTKLTWNAVPNATGYKLYDNNKLVADFVDIFSYEIPLQPAKHNYTVEAYTDTVGYHDVSLKSNTVEATVSLGDNLQATKGTDFEKFTVLNSGLLTTSGWKADSTGGDVIFVSASALENELVKEDTGNKCFKFYTATNRNTSVNFAGNTAFAKAGLYKMSAKVKLGSEAKKVDNIGFRFYVAGGTLGTGDITFTGLEKLNSDEWVTLEAYFTVPKTIATTYINMNFWVFTHNDEIRSTDNYVLMDDIEVRAVTLPE